MANIYEYCCKKDCGEKMIGCDVEKDEDLCPGNLWYHLSCVNLEASDLDKIDKYICNACNLRTKEKTIYHNILGENQSLNIANNSSMDTSIAQLNHSRSI